MIASIRGILIAASPLSATIEAGGIGYEVHVPVTTAARLPGQGTEVLLHTHAVYREDSQTLYGFAGIDERNFFRLLVNHVSGVGPRVALSLMSHMSLELLESAIVTADADRLSKCPGIGRKTAERIILDLKDRLGVVRAAARGNAIPGATGPTAGGTAGTIADATAALLALGYKAADAETAVRKAHALLGETASTEALIKRALS